jgi:vancomycin permeability regulator SanA
VYFCSLQQQAVEYRLQKAIQLYKEGRAQKILFSGSFFWEGTNLQEAHVLKTKQRNLKFHPTLF